MQAKKNCGDFLDALMAWAKNKQNSLAMAVLELWVKSAPDPAQLQSWRGLPFTYAGLKLFAQHLVGYLRLQVQSADEASRDEIKLQGHEFLRAVHALGTSPDFGGVEIGIKEINLPLSSDEADNGRMLTCGEFYDALVKWAEENSAFETKAFLEEWLSIGPADTLAFWKSQPLREDLLLPFAEDMAGYFRERLEGICTEGVYEIVKVEGHRLLQTIHTIAEEFGLEVGLHEIDVPLTPTETILAVQEVTKPPSTGG